MKNTKLTSVLLAILTVGTLVFDLLKANAELFGIDLKIITIIGLVLTVVKIIYDNSFLFTEKQIVSFGNFVLRSDQNKGEIVKGNVTHADIENWKELNR